MAEDVYNGSLSKQNHPLGKVSAIVEPRRVITLPTPTQESLLCPTVCTKHREVKNLLTERWCQKFLGAFGLKDESTQSRETMDRPEALAVEARVQLVSIEQCPALTPWYGTYRRNGEAGVPHEKQILMRE